MVDDVNVYVVCCAKKQERREKKYARCVDAWHLMFLNAKWNDEEVIEYNILW